MFFILSKKLYFLITRFSEGIATTNKYKIVLLIDDELVRFSKEGSY